MTVDTVRGREALIRMTVRGFGGRSQKVGAVVDSGEHAYLRFVGLTTVGMVNKLA